MVPTRQTAVISLLLLAGGVGAGPASLEAQRRNAPPADAPRLMVHTLRSDNKDLGVRTADAIRKRIADDFSKNLGVISEKDIKATLEASGFDPNAAPDPITARLLAQQLRADEYMDGTATKTPKGVRAETRMVLTRDADMAQPLPPAEGKPGDVAKAVSRSLKEARKQLGDVRKCQTSLQGGKPQDAVAAARAAIRAYPQSTLGRVCLAEAYAARKAPNDSIIAVTNEILKLDPRSRPALRLSAEAYKAAGNGDRAIQAWTTLLATDPKNVKLQTQVVNELAAARKPELAKPIIDRAVAENPGDPDLIRLRWLVSLAAKDWKTAISTGEQMIKSDTAALADTMFFIRLAAAYASDSQPQKAAETTARGVARHAKNGTLWSLHAQTLRLAGQTQQSVDAAKRALAINPKLENGWIRLAQAQLELGQTDSAIVSLKQAVANGEDSTLVGQTLLVEGNKAYKAAVASKAAADSSKSADDMTRAREDFGRAVGILSQADSLAPSPTVKFLLGAAAFQLGDAAVRQNQKAKSCDLATEAEGAFATAQVNVPAGGSVQPDAAKQLMDALGQYQPVVAAQKKRFCKGNRPRKT